MTAIIDTELSDTASVTEPAIPEEPAAPELEPAPESAPPPEPKLTRVRAITLLNAALNAWADQMILARRLTLGTANVQSQALCKSGTEEFMTRGRLQPSRHHDRHPANEPTDVAAEHEQKIRTWVHGKFDGAIEDYTATGLMKRIPKIIEQHEAWRTEFRNLVISKHKSNLITLERMQEVLPQLGMEIYEPRLYVSISSSVDWHVPVSDLPGATDAEKAVNLRNAIQDMFQNLMGERGSQDGCNYPFRASGKDNRYMDVRISSWR